MGLLRQSVRKTNTVRQLGECGPHWLAYELPGALGRNKGNVHPPLSGREEKSSVTQIEFSLLFSKRPLVFFWPTVLNHGFVRNTGREILEGYGTYSRALCSGTDRCGVTTVLRGKKLINERGPVMMKWSKTLTGSFTMELMRNGGREGSIPTMISPFNNCTELKAFPECSSIAFHGEKHTIRLPST